MTKKVGIDVEAKLNTSAVEQGAGKLDRILSKLSGKKIDPIPADAARKAEALFQSYLKLDREMARRLKHTNQGDKSLGDIDWSTVYVNQHSRAAKLRQLSAFLANGGAPVDVGGGGGGGGGMGAAARGIAVNTAQAGMRAGGAAGGVAAGALGTGMSAGFGAGLLGLVGGIAALGVGKLVAGVAENIQKAEDNNIALDRLKRTVGDVAVSFSGLKAATKAAGDGLRITYDEAIGLSQTFAKSAKLSGDEYRSLPQELGVGVGLARAYGLETEQGVGFMGQMRGLGITRDTQDSRRMALLVGETIAKSDAFAKADEVLQAIADFASSQTKANLATANVQGYAGMFSAMVGSGIPGLDPSNTASILSRINSSLSSGGAMGEASQFFTARLAERRGMDVFDARMWREGGAFATADGVFGDPKNSAVAQFYQKFGLQKPGGSQTHLAAALEQLKQDYGNDPKMMLEATANHLGINMSQAASLHLLDPNRMGELEKYAPSMTNLSASGIRNVSAAVLGTDADRVDVARSLMGAEGLKAEDRKKLQGVIDAGGAGEQSKEVLATLSAQYEQEKTMGSDIRDTRAAVDNIKTAMADYVVPYLNEMRRVLVNMAGGGNKTPSQVMADVMRAEQKDEQARIDAGYDAKVSGLMSEQRDILSGRRALKAKLNRGEISQEEYDKQWAAGDARLKEIGREMADAATVRDAEKARSKADLEGRINGLSNGSAYYEGGAVKAKNIDAKGRTKQAMDYFMSQGWTREQAAGIVANLHHESGMNESAVGDGGKAFGIAQWHPDRQENFRRVFGKDIREATYEEQLAFVNWEMTQGAEKRAGNKLREAKTAREAGDAVSRYYERPARVESEAAARGESADRLYRTPMPETKGGNQTPGSEGGAGGGRGSAVSFEPLFVNVKHTDSQGRTVAPDETLQTRVNAPNPVFA